MLCSTMRRRRHVADAVNAAHLLALQAADTEIIVSHRAALAGRAGLGQRCVAFKSLHVVSRVSIHPVRTVTFN